MRKHVILQVSLSVALACVAVACGPSCPEVKSELDESQMMADDVARVNALAAKRRVAVEEAQGGELDAFSMERLKFSVTAYELAVQVQIRAMKLSPRQGDSPLYSKHLDRINEMRCFLDEMMREEGHLVSDADGRDVQRHHARFRALFQEEGEVSGSELRGYYENGITTGPK